MAALELVEFNGLGQPRYPRMEDGDILILVQDHKVSIVRLELLPPEKYGPSLEHALNEQDLEQEAYSVVMQTIPHLLKGERHYTLRCPPKLASRAVFKVDT